MIINQIELTCRPCKGKVLHQLIALNRKRGAQYQCLRCGNKSKWKNYDKIQKMKEYKIYQMKVKQQKQIEAEQTAIAHDKRFKIDPEEDAWLEGRI